MDNKSNLVQDKRLKTRFLSPLELKNYMSILGAEIIDNNNFVLDGLRCTKGFNGVCFLEGIPENIAKLFEEYGLEDSISGNTIYDLEGLIFLQIALRNESIEELFNKNLEQAKRKMLEQVLAEKEIIYFYGPFSDFDRAITPFLNDDFDSEKFLEQCVFNTTGYYEEGGYNKSLKFQWKTKQDPDIHHVFLVDGEKIIDYINFKKWGTKFNQQLLHTITNDEDKIEYFYCSKFYIEYDVNNEEIKESVISVDKKRKATKFDFLKMRAIAESFQDKELSFEKSNVKIKQEKK